MPFQFPADPIATSSIANPATGQRYDWDGTKWTTVPIYFQTVQSSSYAIQAQSTQNWVPSQKSHISVGRTGTLQTGIGVGTDIILNTIFEGTGPLSNTYNTTTGVFTLEAGLTYELFASLWFVNSTVAATVIKVAWVDAVTNTRIIDDCGDYASSTLASAWGWGPYAIAIYRPTTTQTVKLRCVQNDAGTCELYNGMQTAWIYRLQ